jgi:hypothetical protein
MQKPPGSNNQKRTPPWWSRLLGPVAWLLQISSPHPQEPMQKRLTNGGIAGFYIIVLTGRENN